MDNSNNIDYNFSIFIDNWEGFQIIMNFKEILFWVFLVISLILLIWYIFGNSPSEFFAAISIILMLTFKIWSVSDRSIKHEMQFKMIENNIKGGFNKIKNDIKEIRDNIILIKKKLKI